MLILSLGGLFFAAIRKDLFVLLLIIPFLLFLYLIDYVSYWHVVPILPALCISAAVLIDKLCNRIKSYYNTDNVCHQCKTMKMILPILIVLGIAVFGLVSSTQLISIDLTSFYFETLALIVFNLGGVHDESASKITLVGDLYYQLIPLLYVQRKYRLPGF